MNLLGWFQKQTRSGIEATFSEVIKLAILGFIGFSFNYLVRYFPDFTSSVWTSKRFSIYDATIWIVIIVTASVWITYSVMQRVMRRVELEAREQSRLDPATGLLNLRALNEQLPEAMQERSQTKQPISLIIFDIDNFKEVNTLVGHAEANVILKETAELLSPRAPDQAYRYPENVEQGSRRAVFRYGGDEFIVIAFNTTVDGGTDIYTGRRVFHGKVMADRLQENVWRMDFPRLIEKQKERGLPTRLTVSAGIADSHPSLDPDDTADELTRRAELALMEAKRLNTEDLQKDERFKGRIVAWSRALEEVSATSKVGMTAVGQTGPASSSFSR